MTPPSDVLRGSAKSKLRRRRAASAATHAGIISLLVLLGVFGSSFPAAVVLQTGAVVVVLVAVDLLNAVRMHAIRDELRYLDGEYQFAQPHGCAR